MTEYQKALQYIYHLNKYGIKLGLENIAYLLSLLGNPQERLNIIHIGGTNGKGSTAAIISSILQTEGFKVGLYTSPHLVEFNERMKINGQNISSVRVVNLLEKIKPYLKKTSQTKEYRHPTFFEVITAMAFLYFFEEKVDFLVLEVGLGGRLDATNVCKPLLSVITRIDYDHMDKLGNSLEKIAWEKAGIIKPEGIVISSTQYKKVRDKLKDIAKERRCILFTVGEKIRPHLIKADTRGIWFDIKGIYGEYKNLFLSLVGKHQLENVATAITAVEALKIRGFDISLSSIREGLKRVTWEGRLEIIQERPFIVLDGAHNPSGIKTVYKNLLEIFSYRRLILVLAIFSDKDFSRMIKIITPIADLLITSKAKNPRATSPEIIAQEASRFIDQDRIIITQSISQAIQYALKKANQDDLICITGSLYMVGEAKQYFIKKQKILKNSK